MLKKCAKGLLTVILLIVTGIIGILEIGIEVIYQIVRLCKRGFGYLANEYIRAIEPVYNGKLKLKIKQRNDKTETIKVYEFTYEE